MALMQLLMRLAPGPVHHAATFYRFSLSNRLGPAQHVFIGVCFKKLSRFVYGVVNQRAVPRVNSYIGNGVFFAGYESVLSELAIKYVELALHFHGVAINRVLILFWRIGIKMAKTAAQNRCTGHLPKQPV